MWGGREEEKEVGHRRGVGVEPSHYQWQCVLCQDKLSLPALAQQKKVRPHAHTTDACWPYKRMIVHVTGNVEDVILLTAWVATFAFPFTNHH